VDAHLAEADGLITRDVLESSLAAVQTRIADPRAGLFGPGSMTWRVDRESALFLGAGRAALLQLAHPWVAVALEQHSSLLANPIARFHSTFRIVFTMVFGSAPQAFVAARSLHQLHTRIGGTLPSAVARYHQGCRYEANQERALQWVYATLIESAVMAYECVLPALSPAERETFYGDSCLLAQLFGISLEALPRDWSAFCAYIRTMESSSELGVDDRSRSMAQKLLAGAGSRIRPPRWYQALTAAWIPARFREGFALPFGCEEQSAAEKAQRWLPRFYRRMPAWLRFVGPFHEARARLAGRSPSPLAQASNRFWIGESLLPFAEDAPQDLAPSASTSASHSASRDER
jgi:uncharacterized protein (DUF2236 family)